MEKNQMKNIVVLKNLPSNLVEEAFIILKSNKLAQSLKYIEKKESTKLNETKSKSKDYIIREAEMVISNYISSLEKKDKEPDTSKIKNKYKWLKIYSTVVTALLVLMAIF